MQPTFRYYLAVRLRLQTILATVWLFDTRSKNVYIKRTSICTISNLFESRDIFVWFLSMRGGDAEESISKLLEDIEVHGRQEMRCYRQPFSHTKEQRIGVDLLAPRNERLHLDYAGLTKHRSSGSPELPLTPEQRERWNYAFKTLSYKLLEYVYSLALHSVDSIKQNNR